MKKLFYFSLVLAFSACLLVSCGGGSGSSDLVGKWQLSAVSGEELTDSEKTATITFESDGKVVQARGKRVKEGKWEMKETDGKKELTITFDKDVEKYEVVELTSSALSFMDGGDKISFTKK